MAPVYLACLISLLVCVSGNRIKRWPQGSSSSSSSFSSSGSGSNSYNSGPTIQPGSGFPHQVGPSPYPYQQPYIPNNGPDYYALFQQFLNQMAAQQAAFNAGFPTPGYNNEFNGGYYPQYNQFAFPGPINNGLGGDGGATASASIGPQGGYGQVGVGPDASGLGLRTGSFNVAPQPGQNGGGSYSSFTSSSSGSSDVNGQKTSYKQASVGVNDNGKVYFKSVSSP